MKKNFLKTLPVQVNAAMLFIALTGTSFAVEPSALISDRASVDNDDNTGSDGRLLFEGAGSYLSTNNVLRVGHRGSGVINVTSGSQINVTGNIEAPHIRLYLRDGTIDEHFISIWIKLCPIYNSITQPGIEFVTTIN